MADHPNLAALPPTSPPQTSLAPNATPLDRRRKSSISTYWASDPQASHYVAMPWSSMPGTTQTTSPQLDLAKTFRLQDGEFVDVESIASTQFPHENEEPTVFPKEPQSCNEVIREKVIRHYTIPDATPSMEEIEADRWIGFPPSIVWPAYGVDWYGHQFFQLKFSRWMLLPAALIMQMCVGTFYAWSGYNSAIDEYIYGNEVAGRAPTTFYIAVAVFGPSAAVLGPWLERNGPRTGALFGAAMYCIGQLVAALAIYLKQIWLLYIGYGVIGGCGLGISYIAPVSPIQKWFPDRRGLASGVAVCGFGAGSIAAPYIQYALIDRIGIVLTFVILGLCYFGVMIVCAMVLRVPPPGFTVGGKRIQQKAIAGTQDLQNTIAHIRETKWEQEKERNPTWGTPTRQRLMVDTSQLNMTDGGCDELNVATLQRSEAKPMPIVTPTRSATTMTLPLANEASTTNLILTTDYPPSRLEESSQVIKLEKVYDTIKNGFSLIDAITSKEFRIMYFMLFANSLLGLTTISKLQDMVKFQFGRSPQEAVAVNSIVACFNLGGRLFLSFMSDKIGRKTVFLATLLIQAFISASLPTVFNTQAYPVFVFLLCMLTACYGGGFGVIPAFLADMFGAQNVGATHGIILTTWSLGGVVGALVVNTIVNHNVIVSGDKYALWIYNVNFIWICVVTCFGFIVTVFLCTRLQDRWLPEQFGEVLRVRLWRWLVIWKRPCNVEALDHQREMVLWRAFLGNAA